MDPSMMGMDPSMMGGAPPMDPSMMGMDPSMMGGAPPMDPSMMGGAPPMDPSMMGGAPAPAEGAPPEDITETIRRIIQEELAASGGGGGGSAKPKAGGKINIEQDLGTIKTILAQMADALGLQVPASTSLGQVTTPQPSDNKSASMDGKPISHHQAGQSDLNRARHLADLFRR